MAIQDLIDAASPGSVVDVLPGVYNEQIIINKPLTLQGPLNGGVTAVIDATSLAAISTIQILSSHVTVKRLTIQNGPSHGIQAGDAASTNLSNIVISNNHIKGHGNAGILTNHSASMEIDNNIIEDNGIGSGFNRGGIILYPHGPTNITSNTIVNNTIDGIFARGSASGLIIEDNKITNHANSGITLAWDQQNTKIVNNQIKHCGSDNFDEQGGIVIIQSMAEVIQKNKIENCTRSGIFWGWVPTVGDSPNQILISENEIKNSFRDGIYLFSQGPGGFISPDLFPLKPTIKKNTLLDNHRAGVYVSNLYYYSPGNANPTICYNEITGNLWGVFNGTSQIVNAINNWWGSSSGPFQPTLNPQGTGDPVSNNVDFIPWLDAPPVIAGGCCAIFTDDTLRTAFGYTKEAAACECHDICVENVRDICVKHRTPCQTVPCTPDGGFGCRGSFAPNGLPEIESIRVLCADDSLDTSTCLRIINNVQFEAILSYPALGPIEARTLVNIRDTFDCHYHEFAQFPSGVKYSQDVTGRAAFREELAMIDGSCKVIIINNATIQMVNNVCTLNIDYTVVDKLWKHENLLVSALKPYEDNITVSQAFGQGHAIGICQGNGPCPKSHS